MSNSNSCINSGFLTLLGIIFVILKLCNVIAWSWWWVTCPFWIIPAIFAVCFLPFLAVFLFILAVALVCFVPILAIFVIILPILIVAVIVDNL